MILEKLNLGEYGDILFEKEQLHGGLRSELPLKNGYYLTIATNFNNSNGFYGHWEEKTFEIAVLNKNKIFIFVDEIDDEDYKIDGGIWSYLSVDEILEKIKIIEKL